MSENVLYVRCTALANDDSINILFYDEIITWFGSYTGNNRSRGDLYIQAFTDCNL